MIRTVRNIVALAAALSAAPVQSFAQPQTAESGLWSELEIPGTPAAFAHAVGVSDATEPRRLLLEWARVRHLGGVVGSHELKEVPSRDLKAYLSIIEPLRSSRALLGPDLSLALASRDRDRFGSLLEAVGLRLSGSGRNLKVSTAGGQEASAKRALLTEMGIDPGELETKLNGGQTVRLALPTFNALLPLPVQWWRDVLSQPGFPASLLFNRIVEEDNVAFLYYGLASAPLSFRQHLLSNPKLGALIHKKHAALFASSAGSFRVSDAKVSVPGDAPATELWEELVGERVSVPERFFDKLLGADSGRLARFYSRLDALEPSRLSFALRLADGLSGPALRSHGKELYSLWFESSEPNWVVQEQPFLRANLDPFWLLSQLSLDRSGRLSPPNRLPLWQAVFDSREIPERPKATLGTGNGTVDALSLVRQVFRDSDGASARRLDTFLFGQRVFGASAEEDSPDVVVALRGFARFRMLHLTLERIGARAPTLHARAARRAEALSEIENPDIAAVSLSQFQGGLALIERAVHHGRVTASVAEALVTSLVDTALLDDGSYGAGIAQWLRQRVVPTLSASARVNGAESADDLLLRGVVGFAARPEETPSPTEMTWEGWRYRLDRKTATFERARQGRESQHANALDDVLSLAAATDALRAPASLEVVRTSLTTIQRLRKSLREPRQLERLTNRKTATAERALSEATKELARIGSDRQLKNGRRTTEFWLEPLCELVTADYLRSLVYALSAPDDDSPLLADESLSSRHNLGLRALSRSDREPLSWGLPLLTMGQGPPSIRGALLGLDLALAEVALRRVTAGVAPVYSYLGESDRRAFAQALLLFRAGDPRLKDVGIVTAAIAKGRERIASLPAEGWADARSLDAVRLAPLQRSLIEWTLLFDPAKTPFLFSTTQLLRIADDDRALAASEAWGSSAVMLSGCLCLSVPPNVDWNEFAGRNLSVGTLAPGGSDLLLRLAELAEQSGLPSDIAVDVLPFGLRDVLDTQMSHRDDWSAFTRAASTISRRSFEDYVSRFIGTAKLEPTGRVN